MKLNPKNGIDTLLFGMKQKDVEERFGKADKQFKDEEGNVILLYFDKRLRLTFYEEEEFRLGYIITSHPEVEVLGIKLIGVEVEVLKKDLPFKSWEVESFDSTENHFNESNWLILQSEFGTVIRVEIGALIDEVKDEFQWKF